MVPTKIPINDDVELATRENYNVLFAREIQEMYGIDAFDTPCIVLDNFDDSTHQLVIRLPEEQRKLKAVLLDISRFVRDRMPTLEDQFYPSDQWRRRTIDELYNHLKLQEAKRALVAMTPKIASIILSKGGRVLNIS